MTSRRRSDSPSRPRRSRRSHNVSESQSKTHTSTEETPKRNSVNLQEKRETTLENQTPAQQSLRRSERIKSTLKSARIFRVLGRTPGRSGRPTPYKTPRLGTVPWHRVSARTSVKKEDARKWNEHLKGLLHRPMKLCNLSSLANFQYKDEKLRVKYEKTLKNKVLEVFPSPLVVVKFTLTSCLSWHSSVIDAVWLEVTSLVPGDTADQDKMVVVYSAWLIRTTHIQSSRLKNMNWLPVMLYTGRELIHQVVVNWVQGSFQCYVARCGMRQSDLLWMAGLSSRLRCRKSSHNLDECKVEFSYLIIPPCGTTNFPSPNDRGKPRTVIKVPLKDVREVWNRLVGDSSNEVSLEDLQRFLSAIDGVTSHIIGLPSSHLRLQQVSTPCFVLNSNGKVRLTCKHSMSLVIQSLMDVFIQTTTCYNPDDHLQDSDKEDTVAELNNNYE